MKNKLKLIVSLKTNYFKINKDEINKIKVVDNWNYDEIYIVCSDFIIFSEKLLKLISGIKTISHIQYNKVPKIYVCTNYCLCNIVDVLNSTYINNKADGIILTPYKEDDINGLIYTNEFILTYKYKYKFQYFQLNLLPNIKNLLPNNIDLSMWDINNLNGPENLFDENENMEDVRRIYKLWEL